MFFPKSVSTKVTSKVSKTRGGVKATFGQSEIKQLFVRITSLREGFRRRKTCKLSTTGGGGGWGGGFWRRLIKNPNVNIIKGPLTP